MDNNEKNPYPYYGANIFSFFRLLLVLLCFFTFQVQAQDSTLRLIKGKVADNQGEPVIQASVIEAGTRNGTVTDVNGNFTIQVNPKAKLLISSVGYESLEVDVPDKGESMVIILEEDAKALEEVVVIGYGTTKRSEFTGAANVVDMEAMLKTPVKSITEGLAGRASGVQVSTQDGQPGVESDVIIRGASSMSQSNSPLYVVDGIPIENFDQSSLNPNDIESMSILKDASSTSIYGARGTNGVIVITTKRGSAGRPIVNLNSSLGFQKPTKLMEVMSPYEYLKYQQERDPRLTNSYYFYDGKTLEDYRDAEPVNFQDHLFRTANIHNHNVSIRGGTNATRYNVSLSAYIQDGIVINSGHSTYRGRLSLDQTINKKVRVGISTNYSDMTNFGSPVALGSTGDGQLTLTNYLFVTAWGYRPVAGLDSTDFFEEDVDPLYPTLRVNPITATKNEYVKRKWNVFMGNAHIDYDIIENLTLRVRGGVTRTTITDESFYNSKTTRGRRHPLNVRGINAIVANTTYTGLSNENTLTYRLRTEGAVHNFNFLLGQSANKFDGMRYGYSSYFIPSEELGMSGIDDGMVTLPVATPSLNTSLSFFGRVHYHYRGRYVFSTTVRRDGSSRFAKGSRWGTFPSVSFAWNAFNERFMRNLKIVSNLRLRFSHGITGNSRVSDFAYLAGMRVSAFNPAYSFNNATPSPGMYQTSMENNNLRWESSPQTDIGIDLGFFKERIKITADVYHKLTNGLLMNVNMPSHAPAGRVFMNSGQIENKGWEFELKTVNVRVKNFTWTTDFNISRNVNKVLKLADNQPVLYSDVSFHSQFNMPAYISAVGKPMGQFWGLVHDGNYQYEDFDNPSEGVYILKDDVTANGMLRSTIRPGDIKYKDLDGDLDITSEDRTYLGSPFPKFIGGMANDFQFKNFDLNVFLQWSYGNKLLNANRYIMEGNATQLESLNQFASYVDRWSPENPTNRNFRTGGQGPIAYSSRVIEDGSFLRLKAVTLGYSVPKALLDKVNIQEVRLSLSANNLITWTKYSGFDPEVSSRNHSILTQGFDFSAYPRNKIITFGLNVTF